jgi:acyl dehydratase
MDDTGMALPSARPPTVSWEGRYLEDFTAGDVYRHPLGRTVLEVDNSWLTLLTQNTAAVHFDRHYASGTQWGKPLVDSTFTLALVTGQSVHDVSMNVLANLGWDRVRLPSPVFEGDTIYSQSEVLSVRESESRPDAAGQTAAGTTSIACLSNCAARSSPEWTMWLCMDRRAASGSRARRFSSIAE